MYYAQRRMSKVRQKQAKSDVIRRQAMQSYEQVRVDTMQDDDVTLIEARFSLSALSHHIDYDTNIN
jgi:serine phosphatase RsbU (regulator of sigma subunit)